LFVSWFKQPHLIPKISEEGILENLKAFSGREMAEDLQAFYQKKGKLDLAEALGRVEEDLKGGICAFVFQENGLEGGDLERVLEDCIQKIREGRLKRDKKELLKRIKEAEKQKGEEGLDALLLERQELAKRGEQLEEDER